VLIAIAGLALGGMMAASQSLLDHTVENSRTLDRQFKHAALQLQRFRKGAGRPPNESEFTSLPAANQGRYHIEFMPNGFDQCDSQTEAFRSIPRGTYVLIAWRGEWWECYAPASGRSTLLLNASDYTSSGSQMADGVILMTIAVGLASFVWIGRVPWRRSASA
jgi:hypothetical protein